MIRKLAALALLLGVAFAWHSPPPADAATAYIQVIEIDGAIDVLSARHLARGIENATDGGAQLVVVKLNTPGGLLQATRDMVASMLTARVPIAVYVSPPGARAASAGTFITAAANFAVMAPGTNIGAASPVAAGGRDIPSTLARKINEDTTAFIRSIADARGRNAKALQETVTLARAYSANEAVSAGIADFVAADLDELLARIDGQTADTAGGAVTVRTENAGVRDLKPTILNSFLGVLASPNIAFALFAIGGILLLIEIISPGLIGPGVIGVIFLALAFLGFGNLPVNWVAVGLLVFAMVLFYLETLHAGISVFGIGGVVSLVVGGLLLFGGFFSPPDIPEPSLKVSLWMIGVFVVAAVAAWLVFMRLVRTEGGMSSAHMSEAQAALEGEWGVTASQLAPTGKIWVANEEWTATTDTGDVIPEGEEVRVLGVYGEVLKVARLYEDQESGDDT